MLRKLVIHKAVLAFAKEYDVVMADEYRAAMLGKRCMTDAQKIAFRKALLQKHGLTEADVK